MRKVGIVLLSHSYDLARGTTELARQMATDVHIVSVGGLPTGAAALGTDTQELYEAIVRLLQTNEHVIVLTDIGSAVLTTETIIELNAEQFAGRVRRAPGPFVEGAVAAAVRAQTGGTSDDVIEAVAQATLLWGPPAPVPHTDPGDYAVPARLGNSLGLHARPAAILARLSADYAATVTINGADIASILALMQLGVAGGEEVIVSGQGPQARQAVDVVVELIRDGFGESG